MATRDGLNDGLRAIELILQDVVRRLVTKEVGVSSEPNESL